MHDLSGPAGALARHYRGLVIERPRLVLLLVLLIGLGFLVFVPDFRLDASADSLLLENDRDLKAYREVARRYASKDFLVLAVTPAADLFAPATLAQLGRLRDALTGLEGVTSVFSILDAPLIRMTSGSLSELARNTRNVTDAGIDPLQARQELVQSPIFSELIISRDGQTTALIINLPEDSEYQALLRERQRVQEQRAETGLNASERQQLKALEADYQARKLQVDQRNHETIGAVRDIMDGYRGLGQLHLGGISMIADDMIQYIQNDLVRFGIGVFVFLVLMLLLIFRRIRYVLLPLACCIFAGLLMIGLLGLLDWPVTVISSNFISLMLILTLSMNIHLVVRYRELARDHADADQASLVLRTTQRMVWPCLYTALTTVIGFASLVVSDIKPVIHFGLMMSIGLLAAFITTFLLFPALLMLFEREAVRPAQTRNRFTPWLGRLTRQYGRAVLLISVAGAGVSLYGMTQLRVENSFINYFRDTTEIYRGQLLIDEKLGGTTPLDIILEFGAAPGGAEPQDQYESGFDELDDLFGGIETDPADSWFTARRLDRITQVHDYLEQLPAVGKVLSLASFLRLMQEVNGGRKTDAFEMALVYKRMPADIRDTLITPYISIEADQARINARIIDSLSDLRRGELLRKIRLDLEKQLGIAPGEFRLTGMLVLYNNMLQSLFRSQVLTLGAVMLGIALMLWVLFRSFRLALIGILPNLLAAAIILGLMGLLEIPLDMMTITIAAITIGIAVDDCIHYIYRFREEFPRRGRYLETMHYCHANIGAAMFYTSLTIIIGFSILILSNFIPTIIFGLLTTLAMFIAMLAALTLLPQLILVFRPFGPERGLNTG